MEGASKEFHKELRAKLSGISSETKQDMMEELKKRLEQKLSPEYLNQASREVLEKLHKRGISVNHLKNDLDSRPRAILFRSRPV